MCTNYDISDIILRALASGNAIPSHFIIPKSYFINYTIPFYNTPNIPKFYFFPFYLNILFYSFFFFYYFSFSIPFPLFLPQPLAPVSTHKATHTHKPMIHRSTYPNPSPHTLTHTHTYKHKPSNHKLSHTHTHTHKHKPSNHQLSHTHTNHQTNRSHQQPPHLQRNPPPMPHWNPRWNPACHARPCHNPPPH